MKRRDFIKLCGAAGIALSAPSLSIVAEASSKGERFVQTRLKMGTIVTIIAVSDSKDKANEAFDAAWKEMDRLVKIFDRHQPGTVVSELNARGRISDPGPEMLLVLNQADEVYRLSKGAFDPTILPLLRAYEKSFNESGAAPDRNLLLDAAKSVDFGGVKFSNSKISLKNTGQQISLDGVAKGYIVDRVAAVLKEKGVENCLVNAGGDIMALGCSESGRPWRIGIQDPFDSQKVIRVVALSDQAVTTSGSYEIFFDKKKKYHHLLSPQAGTPANNLVSATVVAKSAARADALSTAAFIRPQMIGAAGAEGMIVSGNRAVKMTDGFKGMVGKS